MKGFVQINKKDGLGTSSCEYFNNAYLKTINKEIQLCLMNHIPIYYENSSVVSRWKDTTIKFIADRIDFCDVGIFIENRDKTVSFIFSENENGPIAHCCRIKDEKSSK